MALTYSRQLYLHLRKYSKRNAFPALVSRIKVNNFQNSVPVVYYCDTSDKSRQKLSAAMKSYLEKAVQYDKFMKEQLEEYNLGKKFLENMMGKKSGMTQKDVDEAIEYLFPSALFVPKSRPIMKPPQEVFSKKKEAHFDYSGRPFHFLFYTTKPQYSQCLHDAATAFETLSRNMGTPPAPLVLPPGQWFSKEELEKLFLERIFDTEYEKFVEVFTKLSEHPFAVTVEDFIKKYWKPLGNALETDIPTAVREKDGVKVVKVEG